MTAGIAVPRNEKPKQGRPARGEPAQPEVPDDQEDEKGQYTQHVLVRLGFKERLDSAVMKANQQRRRAGKKGRARGWYVEKYLTPWLESVEAELSPPPE